MSKNESYELRPSVLSYPKVRQVAIGHGHLLAVTILIGPDDVRDVGMGNERYDAITPSGSGVGLEVDGGHCKSSCSSRPQGSSVVMSSGSSEHLCGFRNCRGAPVIL